jgi:hypothetical protein
VSTRIVVTIAAMLAGCAAAPLAPGTSKDVRGQPLPPHDVHEECFAMARGDVVRWRFVADEAVDFAVQYRDGKVVVLPLVRERVIADDGRFAALVAERYCLTWEAGRKGASLDYVLDLVAAPR